MNPFLAKAPQIFAAEPPDGFTDHDMACLAELQASGYLPDASEILPVEMSMEDKKERNYMAKGFGCSVSDIRLVRVARGPFASRLYGVHLDTGGISTSLWGLYYKNDNSDFTDVFEPPLADIVSALLAIGNQQAYAGALSTLYDHCSQGDFS